MSPLYNGTPPESADPRTYSAHPNVVTFHSVLDEDNLTYIIMDFASDGDCFPRFSTAAGTSATPGTYLTSCSTQSTAATLLNAKAASSHPQDRIPPWPTTAGLSGSCYSASPPDATPWKAATLSDSIFHTYLHNPSEFLTTVLPMSAELNAVLARMLDIDFNHRSVQHITQAADKLNEYHVPAHMVSKRWDSYRHAEQWPSSTRLQKLLQIVQCHPSPFVILNSTARSSQPPSSAPAPLELARWADE
ncbi:hypothetical protein B0H17DRAFT_1331929 [Mycena rosella]|uniref:Uncharacterized protein n=1 Tax=Mycena rosella TaxID=1033263 RepID=A0AAD7GHA2_MYCRO|nr:hypothetical protein B0H17DRAFT_1331929 [Mycena rosella]